MKYWNFNEAKLGICKKLLKSNTIKHIGLIDTRILSYVRSDQASRSFKEVKLII